MSLSTRIPGFASGTMNIDAPRSPTRLASVRAMQIANAAPRAPVTNRLRPLMLQPPGILVASVRSSEGSEPAPGGGSLMANAERTAPAASGRRKRSFCSSLPTSASRCMFPSSGAAQFRAGGPSRLYPASSSTADCARTSRPRPPYARGTVGVSRPGRPGGRLQLLPDVVRRSVSRVGRAPLGGDHDVAHECADTVAKLERLGCEPRVGGQPATTVPV